MKHNKLHMIFAKVKAKILSPFHLLTLSPSHLHIHDCTAIVPAMEVMMVAMIWSTVLTVDHLIFIRF